MRCMVTGGAGFIRSHLFGRLLEKGEVVCLHANSQKGMGYVEIFNCGQYFLRKSESTFIPAGEGQLGEYQGEDDIVRFDD